MTPQDVEGFARAVVLHNVAPFVRVNADRVAHFVARAGDKSLTPAEVCVVLLAVDYAPAAPLAHLLMPGHDWDQYRLLDQEPVARGLAGRSFVQGWLAANNPPLAAWLAEHTDYPVVVMCPAGCAVLTPGQAEQPAVYPGSVPL